MNEDTNELTEQELSQVSGGMLNEELINTQQATQGAFQYAFHGAGYGQLSISKPSFE